jgi:hypothetical protein
MKKLSILLAALALTISLSAQTATTLLNQAKSALSNKALPTNQRADSMVAKAAKMADAIAPSTGSMVTETANSVKTNTKAVAKKKTKKASDKVTKVVSKADAAEKKATDALTSTKSTATDVQKATK